VLQTVGRVTKQATGFQLATLFGIAIAAIAIASLIVIGIASRAIGEPYGWLLVGACVLMMLLIATTLKLHRDLQLVKAELSGIKVGLHRMEEQIQGHSQVISERIGQLRRAMNDCRGS